MGLFLLAWGVFFYVLLHGAGCAPIFCFSLIPLAVGMFDILMKKGEH